MQETRQAILDILKNSGQATVDELVDALRQRRSDAITAVTVRHHLNLLQQDALIATLNIRHRSTPGRPQHVYALTEKARDHFPNNYEQLATGLMEQLRAQLPPEGVNVILEGVATRMAEEANIGDVPLNTRLELAVAYLNQHGYSALWEEAEHGYILHTRNCPYHHLAQTTESLCVMDMRLVATMLGIVPRLLARVANGDASCAYFIPNPASDQAVTQP